MAKKFLNVKGLHNVFASEATLASNTVLDDVSNLVDQNSVLYITADSSDESTFPNYKIHNGDNVVYAKGKLIGNYLGNSLKCINNTDSSTLHINDNYDVYFITNTYNGNISLTFDLSSVSANSNKSLNIMAIIKNDNESAIDVSLAADNNFNVVNNLYSANGFTLGASDAVEIYYNEIKNGNGVAYLSFGVNLADDIDIGSAIINVNGQDVNIMNTSLNIYVPKVSGTANLALLSGGPNGDPSWTPYKMPTYSPLAEGAIMKYNTGNNEICWTTFSAIPTNSGSTGSILLSSGKSTISPSWTPYTMPTTSPTASGRVIYSNGTDSATWTSYGFVPTNSPGSTAGYMMYWNGTANVWSTYGFMPTNSPGSTAGSVMYWNGGANVVWSTYGFMPTNSPTASGSIMYYNGSVNAWSTYRFMPTNSPTTTGSMMYYNGSANVWSTTSLLPTNSILGAVPYSTGTMSMSWTSYSLVPTNSPSYGSVLYHNASYTGWSAGSAVVSSQSPSSSSIPYFLLRMDGLLDVHWTSYRVPTSSPSISGSVIYSTDSYGGTSWTTYSAIPTTSPSTVGAMPYWNGSKVDWTTSINTSTYATKQELEDTEFVFAQHVNDLSDVIGLDSNGDIDWDPSSGITATTIKDAIEDLSGNAGHVYHANTDSLTEGTFAGTYGAAALTLNTASGLRSHAEGINTSALDSGDHAEGRQTVASGGYGSHAEGWKSVASGLGAHAEGHGSLAKGIYSHAGGNESWAIGAYSFAHGELVLSSGTSSLAYGNKSLALAIHSYATGFYNRAKGLASIAEGGNGGRDVDFTSSTVLSSVTFDTTNLQISASFGDNTDYTGEIMLAFVWWGEGPWDHDIYFISSSTTTNGVTTLQLNTDAHSEFGHTSTVYKIQLCLVNNDATGISSHAEGIGTKASGTASHTEGYYTIADSSAAHAEGFETEASGEYSHAEGVDTIASGNGSHAEGVDTIASGNGSHAEGIGTTASGTASHAEGQGTNASGTASHAEGQGTIADKENVLAIGRFNLSCGDNALFVIGNGLNASSRKTVFTVNGAVNSNVTVSISGRVKASDGFFQDSDKNIKNIISDLDLQTTYELVDKCQTIIYTLKEDPNNTKQIGMIAQEVQEFFPEIVNVDEKGILSLDYSRLTVIIFKVLKDLIKRISKLEEKIKD